jgi:hypothetical protein
MGKLADYEYLTFAVTLVTLWLAVELGAWVAARVRPVKDEERGHLGQVTGASLSILALIIGFSFSAAIGRYDQRKSYEQEEASAISSEYDLAGLLPDADTAQLRSLIAQYVKLRVAFYETPDKVELASLRTQRTGLQDQMWPIVLHDARESQTATMGQVVAGLNAMVSRPEYSVAAAADRIPDGAWTLMAMLAFVSCLLLGYGGHGRQTLVIRLVLPLLVALAFFFIASLDTQRVGLIRVHPDNLLRVESAIEAEQKK